MSLIPEYLPARKDYLIGNQYEIQRYSDPDEFHIVIYYVDPHTLKMIVRRMDSESGWGLHLQIKIWDQKGPNEILTIGSSKNNEVIRIFQTNSVELFEKIPRKFQKVPKKIVQTYASITPQSLLHYNAVMTWIEMNPDYEYYFYDNKKSREFIKIHFDSNVLKAYDQLIPKAFKADLFRYCWIYIHGGCYFDHKYICKIPISDYLCSEDRNVYCRDRPGFGILNGIVISEPQANHIFDAIQTVIRNVENHHYGKCPLSITGPTFFHQFTHNQNIPLRHAEEGGKVFYGNQLALSTGYNGYYNNQKLRKESYQDIWQNRTVFYKNYFVHEMEENLKYIIMEKPLQETSDEFEYEVIQNRLMIKRIDSSGGWGQKLLVTIINHQTNTEKDLYVGPSESNIINVPIGGFLI